MVEVTTSSTTTKEDAMSATPITTAQVSKLREIEDLKAERANIKAALDYGRKHPYAGVCGEDDAADGRLQVIESELRRLEAEVKAPYCGVCGFKGDPESQAHLDHASDYHVRAGGHNLADRLQAHVGELRKEKVSKRLEAEPAKVRITWAAAGCLPDSEHYPMEVKVESLEELTDLITSELELGGGLGSYRDPEALAVNAMLHVHRCLVLQDEESTYALTVEVV